ncbi:uncharacterized protein EI97DRAFT_481803 [Westerdykella ornata]|uniref:Uncharacterized protein n=1 Tax=Westerdykella ornata TaxID=318751 RepID=A0A6A6JTI4_WESOR|nr:uncharacterized protein EI97DRAFT_481803 [Westerdykella ornata]KAF2279423.1 hypothetical protein EI97DRAFT_481803 [Westerdykella ornata]
MNVVWLCITGSTDASLHSKRNTVLSKQSILYTSAPHRPSTFTSFQQLNPSIRGLLSNSCSSLLQSLSPYTVAMGGFRSLFYLAGPPILLAVSIPMMIFAVITTTVAISALTLRVSIVYFELAVALIQAYLFPPLPKPFPEKTTKRHASPHRTRHRLGSLTSSTSSDTPRPPPLHNKSASFVSLVGPGEVTRDYEGLGGWRMAGEKEDEALWAGMNSRLELPAMTPKRHHHRSLTAGSHSPRWRRSPTQSRARTPCTCDEKHAAGGYFSLQPSVSSTRLLEMKELRQRNTGGSNTSGATSRRTSVTMKEQGP